TTVLNTKNISDYEGDELAFFSLNGGPLDLVIGNYFLVINSTNNSGRYSIPILPHFDNTHQTTDPRYWGDLNQREDHTFAISTDNGTTWSKKYVTPSRYVVDAAPFIVEMERYLVPSDLNMTLEGLDILNITMEDDQPFSDANYEWGLGNWSYSNLSIHSNAIPKYDLDLAWNDTIMADFTYNASIDIEVSSHEQEPTECILDIDELPRWTLDFNFTTDLYPGWTGNKLNFTYPCDWTALNLTGPDSEEYLNSTLLKPLNSSLLEYGEFNDTYQEGIYEMRWDSPDYMKSIETFLYFNDTTRYKANEFQTGDSMSARLHVQDNVSKPVLNGAVNFTVYRSDETVLLSNTTATFDNTLGFTTSYNFGDAVQYGFQSGDASGLYRGVGYWFNGSEAGIEVANILKIEYDVTESYIVEQSPDHGLNRIYGIYETGVNETGSTDLLYTHVTHVTVDLNNDTGISVLPNQSFGDFTFNEFNQSESIFNPGETIDFTLNVSSDELIFDHDISAAVEIIQYNQPDRAIVNLTMSPVVLNYTTGINDTYVLNFTTVFPAGNVGYNAPIRNCLYQTRVLFFQDGDYLGAWKTNDTLAAKLNVPSAIDNDGRLISVKLTHNATGKAFSHVFNRTTDTVFGRPTMYMGLLESEDGVTFTSDNTTILTNTMTSNFTGVQIYPVDIVEDFIINNNITIEGNLSLENGSLYENTTTIQVYFEDNGTWMEYNTTSGTNNVTVENGTFSADFVLPPAYVEKFNISLNWTGQGQPNLACSEIYTIYMINYVANFQVTSLEEEITIFGDHNNFYSFEIENTGNTTLIFQDWPEITNVSHEITNWIAGSFLTLAPNESFIFELKLLAPNPGIGQIIDRNFTVNISATSVETKETIEVVEVFYASIKAPELFMQLGEAWYVLFILIIVGAFLVTFLLVKRTRKMAKKPVEVGALAVAGKERKEKPYIIKKASEMVAKKPGKKETEKQYKDIDDIIDEIDTSIEVEETGKATEIAKELPEKEKPKKEPVKKEPEKEAPKKEAPKKEAPKKEAPKKEAPKKEAPKKEAPKKEAPKKKEPKKKEPKKKEPKKKELKKEAPKKKEPKKKEPKKEAPEKKEYKDIDDIIDDIDISDEDEE
ncbi:MAG: hypothetical protein ACFFCS_08950, partial [Candidatus Hodarchaeota archaeon]